MTVSNRDNSKITWEWLLNALENDMRVRAFFSSLEDLSKRVEKIHENNKPALDGERYYNDKELAVKLKVSRRSLQDYRNNGILPYIRVGGKILYKNF